VPDYWLVAEPTTTFGRGEIYYANASGVIYQTKDAAREDVIRMKQSVPPSPVPPADSTMLTITDSPVPSLLEIRRCLVEQLGSATGRPLKQILGNRCLYLLSSRGGVLTINVGPLGSYRVAFDPRRNVYDSTIVAFSISARPKTYGVDGLPSYFIDEAGVVHWTSDDREATLRDRVVLSCETSAGTFCLYLGSLDTLKKGH
jgi:hypothetical protein